VREKGITVIHNYHRGTKKGRGIEIYRRYPFNGGFARGSKDPAEKYLLINENWEAPRTASLSREDIWP